MQLPLQGPHINKVPPEQLFHHELLGLIGPVPVFPLQLLIAVLDGGRSEPRGRGHTVPGRGPAMELGLRRSGDLGRCPVVVSCHANRPPVLGVETYKMCYGNRAFPFF